MKPHDSNLQNCNPEADPFVNMATAARDVEPGFSAELHTQLMSQISAAEQSPPQIAYARQDGESSVVASPVTLRPITRQTAPLGSYIAVAACVLLVLIAGLWLEPAGDPASSPQGASVTALPGSGAGMLADTNPATTTLPPEPARDHEDLTAAINYFLTLGGPSRRGNAGKPTSPGGPSDRETPWLRPTVSAETLAFQIDQQRLEQLTSAFFAMD